MDLREMQKPIKERYKEAPEEARITLTARGSESGGPGTGACSGDLLLGALAACAQITCQMVATALGIETEKTERYCTVLQTLKSPPQIETQLSS